MPFTSFSRLRASCDSRPRPGVNGRALPAFSPRRTPRTPSTPGASRSYWFSWIAIVTGNLLHDNFLPESLRGTPAAAQPYLIARDTFVQRLYAEHAGYWQSNGDGIDLFTR